MSPRRTIGGDARASATAVPLAEAKLAPPRLRTGIVDRARIVTALDNGVATKLTLIAAPPGYGKTTAVRSWCELRGARAAWLTLDAGDNDLARLWRYTATAVARASVGDPNVTDVPGLLAAGAIKPAIDELMNGVAASPHQQLVIVLDDLHTVTDPDCLASLTHALERLPPNARIIAMTRTDPELGLAELRARGSLIEVRASELAFTAAESRVLFVDRGLLDLAADDIQTLVDRTEGWPAALLLAWVWLRGLEDPGAAIRRFGADHRFVADYLSDVAFGSLREELRLFLLKVSVLGRFTPALCDELLERADSAQLLTELEHSFLFVERLEHGEWFRVHPLVAEFAELQLSAIDPNAATELHRRAAAWLRERGLAVEAIEHAAAAGDDETIAELLLVYHLVLIRTGGARTLLRWARSLPDTRLVEEPELAAAAATAAQMVGNEILEQRRLLRLVDRARSQYPERVSAYAHAVAGMVRAASGDGDLEGAVEAGREAVEIAECEADDALVAALSGHARALYLSGRPDDAWAAAIKAIEHPDAERRPPGHAFARSTLALVAADRGRTTWARIHAEKAKAIVDSSGGGRTWLGANASLALGAVLTAEGRYADAERHLTYAEQFFRDEIPTHDHARLLVRLAAVQCRRSRPDQAEATLVLAREAASELPGRTPLEALIKDVEREVGDALIRARSGELLEAPSKAELAVLRLLATDLSMRQIGDELYLSLNTVRSHTRSLYRKLGVGCRADAVSRAIALGLTDVQSPM